MAKNWTLKKVLTLLIGLFFLGVASIAATVAVVSTQLPEIVTVADYSPLLASDVFDRNGQKIGDFKRQKRTLIPYEEIPEVVRQAFIAAEDSSFFEHGGVNYVAIFRAMIANIKAGRKVQGGSTITQQLAKTLLLTSEKSYIRKIKEVILAYRMEANLSKEEILFLYLNQIYLGHGAYGIGAASENYFRKKVSELSASEAALLAGLPKAPSRFAPSKNPTRAKQRQRYVLKRMAEEEFITADQAELSAEEPLQFFLPNAQEKHGEYFMELVRQILTKELGDDMVNNRGIKIYTSLDLNKQIEAEKNLKAGLRELDKRQGYRGPIKSIEDPKEIADFLLGVRDSLMDKFTPVRVLQADGTVNEKGPLNLTGFKKLEVEGAEPVKLPNIPEYINVDDIVKGIVMKVDDEWGLITVRFAESKGLIDLETIEWARTPDPTVSFKWAPKVEKPTEVLKKGDVILVKIAGKRFRSKRVGEKLAEVKKKFYKKRSNKGKKFERPETLPEFTDYARLELEQEPIAQAALLALDQKNGDVISMVGGYNYKKSKFNRTYQALRQTGSSFKALVFAAALDKGYTPATQIVDAPIVFEEEEEGQITEDASAEKTSDGSRPTRMRVKRTDSDKIVNVDDNAEADDEEFVATKKWKPMNHSKKFIGDLLFRKALIRSLNVPAVKIMEKIGVPWAIDYAKRLGIVSPLNRDFTLALGSSSVTLYEITKAFAQLGRLGRQLNPIIIHKVVDQDGKVLLEKVSMNERFQEKYETLEKEFEERRLTYLDYMKNPEKYPNNYAERTNASVPVTDGEEAKKIRYNITKEPPLFFENPKQLMKPTTAYISTSLLKGVVSERGGTGGRARSLGRPVAGKTGSTNGYYDGWFVGYTPQIATGVWVGFDDERSLGTGEVGGRSALPIWLEYMKFAHEGLPTQDFQVPPGIVFANIDAETGKLASADSKEIVRQAFVEGTEPVELHGEKSADEEQDFYKEDLSE